TWSNSSGKYECYINSVASGAGAPLAGNRVSNNANDLKIGIVGGNAFNGSIDDLMILNRSLTDEQIINLYNNRTDLISFNETSVDDIWQACVTGNDGIEDSIEVCSDNLTIQALVANTLPTVPELVSPLNNSAITNRTPSFIWNNSVDADIDTLTYQILVDDNSAFNNVEINVSSIAEGTTNTTYDSATTLNVDTVYYWKIRANDSTGYGEFSNVSNFTLQSLLSITISTDTVAFGSLGQNERNDTTDNNPFPFSAENSGNIISNVTITATSYFSTPAFPSEYYQFRIEANETDGFDISRSNMTWVNMSDSSATPHVINLNWESIKNDFLTAINITVPDDEPAGAKSSTVTFTIE
ncbi:MAG: hypothetical protein Q8Q01_01215, partial [archaeon]|nr:hypothetical protein [archaeon]